MMRHFLIFLIFVSTACAAPRQTRIGVHFNQDGKFKIVMFSDLYAYFILTEIISFSSYFIFHRHYAERPDTDWGPANDLKSSKVMRDILDWEKPDFVVFTGDIISEEYLVAPNGTDYIDMLLQPVVEGNYK